MASRCRGITNVSVCFVEGRRRFTDHAPPRRAATGVRTSGPRNHEPSTALIGWHATLCTRRRTSTWTERRSTNGPGTLTTDHRSLGRVFRTFRDTARASLREAHLYMNGAAPDAPATARNALPSADDGLPPGRTRVAAGGHARAGARDAVRVPANRSGTPHYGRAVPPDPSGRAHHAVRLGDNRQAAKTDPLPGGDNGLPGAHNASGAGPTPWR